LPIPDAPKPVFEPPVLEAKVPEFDASDHSLSGDGYKVDWGGPDV
jgi:hypothetical protein